MAAEQDSAPPMTLRVPAAVNYHKPLPVEAVLGSRVRLLPAPERGMHQPQPSLGRPPTPVRAVQGRPGHALPVDHGPRSAAGIESRLLRRLVQDTGGLGVPSEVTGCAQDELRSRPHLSVLIDTTSIPNRSRPAWPAAWAPSASARCR